MTYLHQLGVPGAWLHTPTSHPTSDGGSFATLSLPPSLCPQLGTFTVEQVSRSIAWQDTVRGIHYSTNGQKKIVSCVYGTILDVVVDLDVDSPTFGQWEAVTLDANRQIIIGPGLGHGYCVLSSAATIVYQLSTPYDPGAEREINPLDPALNIPWLTDMSRIHLSPRDLNAPPLSSLREAS